MYQYQYQQFGILKSPQKNITWSDVEQCDVEQCDVTRWKTELGSIQLLLLMELHIWGCMSSTLRDQW